MAFIIQQPLTRQAITAVATPAGIPPPATAATGIDGDIDLDNDFDIDLGGELHMLVSGANAVAQHSAAGSCEMPPLPGQRRAMSRRTSTNGCDSGASHCRQD